ncbi:hypothetical protein MFRU_005g00690 [Monilinia fructicola]|nr:hypothetical protein MFRU_005g00690 [Monilinia fructicola]
MNAELIKKQTSSIRSTLEEFTSIFEKYASVCEENLVIETPSQAGAVAKIHVELMTAVKKLNSDVYGPVNNIMAQFEQIIYSGCLRVLLEAGVFDELPFDGRGMSSSDLAAKTNMEEALLVRLMRVVVPVCFQEKSPRVYNQTANSLKFQLPPLRAMFQSGCDSFAPCVYVLTQYFKENGFKQPDSITNNPYTLAHRTNGRTMWEHLSQHPELFKAFNLAMHGQSTETVQSYGFFPWLSTYQNTETSDDTVLLVDIGGGQGHAITAIKKLIQDTKGRMILQEREEVIREIFDIELVGIEKMTYDFFTPQPIKGALIYYIRRCLHDWPDEYCITILSNIANAMTSNSRLLIAEIVLPEEGEDIEAAWLDITMLLFSGKERSEHEWIKLLDVAGMRLERVYGAEGTKYSVLEAWLK